MIVPITAAALALACDSPRTAIVLEATNESTEPLDEVIFRVSGPGLEGGAREAASPLSGPEARSFPLTLVLVADPGATAGPFDVALEGRRGGQPMARGVRTDGDAPVTFSPGQIVRYHFALRAASAPDSTMPPPTMPPPTMPPPTMMPPPTACTASDTCSEAHHCLCATGCACRFACAPDHCVARCEGAGTSCEVEVAGSKMVNVDCAGGAACLVRGAPAKGDIHFGCAGSKPLDCGNEVLACNRSCP